MSDDYHDDDENEPGGLWDPTRSLLLRWRSRDQRAHRSSACHGRPARSTGRRGQRPGGSPSGHARTPRAIPHRDHRTRATAKRRAQSPAAPRPPESSPPPWRPSQSRTALRGRASVLISLRQPRALPRSSPSIANTPRQSERSHPPTCESATRASPHPAKRIGPRASAARSPPRRTPPPPPRARAPRADGFGLTRSSHRHQHCRPNCGPDAPPPSAGGERDLGIRLRRLSDDGARCRPVLPSRGTAAAATGSFTTSDRQVLVSPAPAGIEADADGPIGRRHPQEMVRRG